MSFGPSSITKIIFEQRLNGFAPFRTVHTVLKCEDVSLRAKKPLQSPAITSHLCILMVVVAGMVRLFFCPPMATTTFEKVPGLAVMQPGAPIPLFSRLPAEWGVEIARLPGVHIVHPEIWTRANVIEGKSSMNPPRFLFGSDLEQSPKLRYSVYREGITEGRALSEADRGTMNAVISRPIADQYKKKSTACGTCWSTNKQDHRHLYEHRLMAADV